MDCHHARLAGLAAHDVDGFQEPVEILLDRQVDRLQAGLVVGLDVVTGLHQRDDQPDAFVLEVFDLRCAAFGTVTSPSAARPLERAQLARPRPPDPLWLRHFHSFHMDT
jgi:hypothetical protein